MVASAQGARGEFAVGRHGERLARAVRGSAAEFGVAAANRNDLEPETAEHLKKIPRGKPARARGHQLARGLTS